MISSRKFENILKISPFIAILGMVFSGLTIMLNGCGKTPSAPPETEFGSLEIHAYFDSTWIDSSGDTNDVFLAPYIDYSIDGGLIQDSAVAVPVLVENLLPGTHNVFIAYEDYNTTFIDTVEPGDTSMVEPLMTQFAYDFTLTGMKYDTDSTTVVHQDSISLSDYLGEVILLFYFDFG